MLSNTEANQALQKSTVEAFNIQLAAKVKDFKDRHSDVAVWSFDSHTLFTAILDNPKDVSQPGLCCHRLSDFVCSTASSTQRQKDQARSGGRFFYGHCFTESLS